MPKLRTIFGTHNVASDELMIFAVFDILSHSIWFPLPILLGIDNSYLKHCSGGLLHITEFYFWTLPKMFVTEIMISIWIANISMKGTVINPAPRAFISHLIVLKFMLDMLVLLVHASSIVELVFYGWCSTSVVSAMLILTIIHHVTLCTNWHWFIPSSYTISTLASLFPYFVDAKLNTWLVDKFGISEFYETSIGFNQIVHLSNETLKVLLPMGDLDLSHGDVIAGLIILAMTQKQENMEREGCSCMETMERDEQIVVQEWMTLKNAKHYLKYAAGVYGWKMFAVQSGKHCKELLSSFREKRLNYFPSSGNVELYDYLAFLVLSESKAQQVVHAELKSLPFQLGYVVLVDFQLKKIIIVLRGSQSVTDFIIDILSFESDSLNVPEVEDARVHYGILETAKMMMGYLAELPDKRGMTILQRAKRKIVEEVGQENGKDFRVVIVGHSLGAAVGAVLSVLLRKKAEYENATCFAFSPPAGLMSESLARYTSSFVFTIFMEHDIVPRCDHFQVIDVKVKILQILRECDVPKYKVLKMSSIKKWKEAAMREVLSKGQVSSWNLIPAAEASVKKYQKRLDEAISKAIIERSEARKFYLPGTLVMVKENIIKSPNRKRKTIYEAHFCQRTTEELSHLSIHRSMIKQHFPIALSKALTYLVK